MDTTFPFPLIVSLYEKVRLIRRFEEVTAEIYPSDKIKSPVHLAIGQEHIAASVCELLSTADVVNGSYRSHALYLAKGGDPRSLMAEMFGKIEGCCKGKGGSMHIADLSHGIMGTSAVVGTGIPNAVGAAMAFQIQGRDNIAVTFFGDGATEEGCFYESLNFAALRKLPILFVCENNGLAIHTPVAKRRKQTDLGYIAESLGVPALYANGGVLQTYEHARSAIRAITAGRGPRFLEVRTHRWREHVGPGEDYDAGYRSRSEAEKWMKLDQMEFLGAYIDGVDSSKRQQIDDGVEKLISDAVAYAEAGRFPGIEELVEDVYA